MRFFRVTTPPLAIVLLAATSSGCGAAREDDTAETSSELRALDASEIVGELAFGETKAGVSYTESPRYRAFKVVADPGDEFDVWVRGARGADPKVWLLGDRFQTLAANDDAAPSTRDAHLVHRVRSGGTYYLAFREMNLEDASFDISLAARTPIVPPPPPPAGSWRDTLPTGDVNVRFVVRWDRCRFVHYLQSGSSASYGTASLGGRIVGTNPGDIKVVFGFANGEEEAEVDDAGRWAWRGGNSLLSSYSVHGTISGGKMTVSRDGSTSRHDPHQGWVTSSSMSCPSEAATLEP